MSYQKDDESVFHVDFAVYAADNADEKLYIAKGKEYSANENKKWELTNPQGLITTIKGKHCGDDAAQFRRVIRYLKKWRTHQFSSNGSEAPTGISLTVLAYHLFSVSKQYDWSTQKYVYDDFSALDKIVKNIKNEFTLSWNSQDEKYYHIIATVLPVEPGNDLFEKMTDKQMENFYQKVVSMSTKLDDVKTKEKKADACSILVNLFGTDFPVTVDKSMVGTSESA